jgi:hypothetical protein
MANFSLLAKIGLDSKAFQSGLKSAESSTKKFSKSVAANFLKAAAAFGGLALGKNMIRLGMDAEEVADKFNTVLGPAAENVNTQISKLMKTVPATRAELQNTIATVSQMGMAFGMNTEAAGKFALGITKISADLASFHNMKPEEVFQKMQAAITGEFEGLKRLGIVINETRLKQEALSLGLGDGKSALDAQTKAITVQNIVLKDMGAALGNAAETQDSSANRTKFFTRQLTELQTEIGTKLIPVFASLLKIMLPFVNIVSNNIDATLKWARRILTFTLTLKVFAKLLPMVSKGVIAYTAAAKAGATATNILSISLRRLSLSIKALLASTGVGLLVVALSELGFMAIEAATKTDAASDDMTSGMDALNKEIEETIALVEESTKSVAAGTQTQGGYADSLDGTAASADSLVASQAKLEDQITSYFDKVKKARAAEQDRFIQQKEFESLQLRSAGNNAAADALDEQIRKTKEAIAISRKHNITLLEAAKLQQGLEDNKENSEMSLQKKITEMKLKALNAQANGDEDAEKAMLRRIKYAEKVVSLMKEFGMEKDEALNLASGILEKEDEKEGKGRDSNYISEESDLRSSLTGDDLLKASNIAGKGMAKSESDFSQREVEAGLHNTMSGREGNPTSLDKEEGDGKAPSNGMEDFSRREREAGLNLAGNNTMSSRGENPTSLDKEEGDVRFERLGNGGYQQFVDGKKGEKFTEEQMQVGLQNQIDKDPSEALLEKINATLEGKFVSQ